MAKELAFFEIILYIEFTSSNKDVPLRILLLREMKPRIAETVTEEATAGDADSVWGFHRSAIVRCGERVFLGTQLGPVGCQKRWLLWQRYSDTWERITQSPPTIREPLNLMVEPNGKLHLCSQPSGEPQHWYSKSPNRFLDFEKETIPWKVKGHWPYLGAGVNERGDLLAVTSINQESQVVPFSLKWAFRGVETGKWTVGSIALPQRCCYTFVALHGRQTYLLTVEDIIEYLPELRCQKEKRGYTWMYVFRKLYYLYSHDILEAPFERVLLKQMERGWILPCDLCLDREGRVHLLFVYSEEDPHLHPDCDWKAVHTVFDQARQIQQVQLGSYHYGRCVITPDNRLHWFMQRRGLVAAAMPTLGLNWYYMDHYYFHTLAHEPRKYTSPVAVELSPITGPIYLATPRGGSKSSLIVDGFGEDASRGTKATVFYFQFEIP